MGILKPSLSLQERKPLSFWRKIKTPSPAHRQAAAEFETRRVLMAEAHFLQALSLERKRAERSRQHFLLMLLAGTEAFVEPQRVIPAVTEALGTSIRETDQCGWYRQNHTLGVIFTEVNAAEVASTVNALHAKTEAALRRRLEPEDFNRIQISFHLFPEGPDGDGWHASADLALHPDTHKRGGARKLALLTKRLVDLGGSAAALLVVSPLLALIAAAVRLTSNGPILNRQVRIGQCGAGQF